MTRFTSRRIQRYSRCARKRKVDSHRYSTEHFFPPPGLGVMGVCGSGGRERERVCVYMCVCERERWNAPSLFSLLAFESSARSSARVNKALALGLSARVGVRKSVLQSCTLVPGLRKGLAVCVCMEFVSYFPLPHPLLLLLRPRHECDECGAHFKADREGSERGVVMSSAKEKRSASERYPFLDGRFPPRA